MIITRFAPSPTGYLHIGGLRTALYSYLWARKNRGKFLLRIEDTDLKRNSIQATKAIEEAFKWVGLAHDGDAVYQSKRFDIYKKYIQQLLEEDKAYYCYASKEELDVMREAQSAKKERPRYDGRYRDFDGDIPQGVEPVVRIKAPLSGKVEFEDGIKGLISFNVEDILDDFIIARSDSSPTYNFVVAIDDHLMGLSDVIRGDDHLSNTPKQIVVYDALGFDIPKFYHVPMILNPNGKKLSKRDGATDVMDYKTMGYLPEAILNFLIRLGWSYKDQEIFSFDEMLELFDPKDINRSASAFNPQKLDWLNAHYIKNSQSERIVEELKFFDLHIYGHDKKELIVDALKERAKTLKEFATMAKNIVDEPKTYDEKAVNKFLNDEALEILENYVEFINNYDKDLHLPIDFEEATKLFMKTHDIKMKQLAQPIRIAMVGSAVSPSVYDVLSIIGKEDVIKRVENLINFKRG